MTRFGRVQTPPLTRLSGTLLIAQRLISNASSSLTTSGNPLRLSSYPSFIYQYHRNSIQTPKAIHTRNRRLHIRTQAAQPSGYLGEKLQFNNKQRTHQLNRYMWILKGILKRN